MDIHVYDVARKFPTQVTFGPEKTGAAIWATGDTRLIYSAQRETGAALMTKPVAGGPAEVLFEDRTHNMFPLSVSPDGRFLLYNEVTRALQGKIAVLPLTGERKPYLLLNSGFSEFRPSSRPTENGLPTSPIAQADGKRSLSPCSRSRRPSSRFPRPAATFHAGAMTAPSSSSSGQTN